MQDKLVLNWTKIAKFLGENEAKYGIRGYTHDEIKRMLEVADIKYSGYYRSSNTDGYTNSFTSVVSLGGPGLVTSTG